VECDAGIADGRTPVAVLAEKVFGLAPRLLMWVMSFLTLGIFWVGQQTQLNHLER
jgi:uncharacterized membrane protein